MKMISMKGKLENCNINFGYGIYRQCIKPVFTGMQMPVCSPGGPVSAVCQDKPKDHSDSSIKFAVERTEY